MFLFFGLSELQRIVVNSGSGGYLFNLRVNDAWERLEEIAKESFLDSTVAKEKGLSRKEVHKVEATSSHSAKIEALEKKVD